ncbi:hypothetical protein [Comamonas sp. JC664]|uniref:hypothetical protein n=1 Tax=Comamonas sp. JC664 TaxID=2801917 RepID=UPI0017496F28|nr:hypothetical protein [Comamonas sp. JC664]MBL0693940.1 hypothetical protein [Comamonas sp. JC664]GHH03826.1 hypothetical protein GCM10012319_72850 [Comamonas sp. KCTC 72670]
MEWSEQPQTLRTLAEIFVPLAVGLVQGVLLTKLVMPHLRERAGGLMGVVHSRANTVFSLLQLAVLLGVVATCNAASAPQTLEWLQARDLFPVPPSLLALRIVAALAAYLIGANLVHLTTVLSRDAASNTLQPLPLKGRRPR